MVTLCGISICFKVDGNDLDIKDMLTRIRHRGNCKPRVREVGCAYLGHVRLAVQGLDVRFAQPMSFKELDKIVLYNGEIYNSKELEKGNECDTLLIPKIPYMKWDGDYAVVVYYKKEEKFRVLTDRFGKKQLFYKIKKGKVLGISSEIKALITKSSNIDYYYLATVGRNGYVSQQNNTFADDIKKFMPGIQYEISADGTIKQLPNISWDSKKMLPDKWVRAGIPLKALMNLSVKRRLTSDIPLAILYSGGLDSTIVLNSCIKNKALPQVFIVENSSDIEFAEKYCSDIGIKPKKITLDKSSKIYDEAHYACESGVDLGSVIPKYSLFKEISKSGYNVCLGGSGADEVFGGYPRMHSFDFQKNDIFNELIYYHLPRLDKLSMYNTIEYRTPYTADYVIDFGLKLPYQRRIDKIHLREEYKKDLPDYIINRPKEALKIDSIRFDEKAERLKLINWVVDRFEDYKVGVLNGESKRI